VQLEIKTKKTAPINTLFLTGSDEEKSKITAIIVDINIQEVRRNISNEFCGSRIN
jgi:hypothetical protein